MDTARGTTPLTGAHDSRPQQGSAEDSEKSTPDGLSHAATYDVEASDPRSTLIDRTGVPPEDLRQIAVLMGALGSLRDAEQRLSHASRRYMQLNETDMRA